MRRIVVIGLCLIAGLEVAGCGGDIQPGELSRSIDTLISSANEGRLVAQGIVDDRTKATFVRTRARELGETVDHEAEKLADASAAPDLTAKKRAAVGLAGEISSALDRLQVDPTDEVPGRNASRTLARLASRAEHLQRSL